MRPITVNVGPLAAASATAIGAVLAALPAGTVPLNNIPAGGATYNTFSGKIDVTGQTLTIDTLNAGVLVGGTRLSCAGLAPNTRVIGPGPTPGTWTIYPPAPAPVVQMQTRGNQVVTLDAPRQVLITNTEAAGNSFTVYGTDAAGNPISETLPTNGGNLTTSQSFAAVTQITMAAAAVGNVSVGTTATATSPWVMFDPWATPASITKQATLTGAATFSVQISNDDPNAPGGPPPGGMTWSNDPDATFVGATTPVEGAWAFVPLYARVLLTAGAGSVRMTFAQQGSP